MAEIDAAWEGRDGIQPSFEGRSRPGILEILLRLPTTNCRKCGHPTCLVFATRLAEGVHTAADCPELSTDIRLELEDFLGGFIFPD